MVNAQNVKNRNLNRPYI